jgi:polyphenol oxidase
METRVIHGTTTVEDGDWYVATRTPERVKGWVARKHRAAPDRSVWVDQVHSNYVQVVGPEGEASVGLGDGLITDARDTVLSVQVADCAGVFVTGPGVIGLGHAGMAGTVGGIVPNLVDKLRRTYDVDPGDLKLWLGPHICARCYRVSKYNQMLLNGFPDAERFVSETEGVRSFAMGAMIADQAARMGLSEITVDAPCTLHDEGYFSYRRNPTTERVMSYLMMTDA